MNVVQAGSFFRLLEMDATEAAPDALERLRCGDLQGVLVHGVYSAELLAQIVPRLERHDPPFLRTFFPAPFRSSFYGRNLNLTHPDLEGYFEEASRFQAQLDELLPRGHGVADHLAPLLSRLDGGRPFQAPPGPGLGERYMFTTIRAHLEGGFIPPHFDNEQALRPSYRHLHTLIEPHLLSFVLALTLPESGGALEIFDCISAPLRSMLNDDRSLSRPNCSGLESIRFRLPPGSLILVDSGRFLHQVTPVEGQTTRWTMCSFLARSRDGDAVYCWG